MTGNQRKALEWIRQRNWFTRWLACAVDYQMDVHEALEEKPSGRYIIGMFKWNETDEEFGVWQGRHYELVDYLEEEGAYDA